MPTDTSITAGVLISPLVLQEIQTGMPTGTLDKSKIEGVGKLCGNCHLLLNQAILMGNDIVT